jgi:hypothetical protein
MLREEFIMKYGYQLPPIDQRLLLANLKDLFPNHHHHSHSLLSDLVHAYLVWWVLMAEFPKRKIAGPAPLWYVRQIHAADQERFFVDAFNYLGRLPQKEDIWAGESDFESTIDTAQSLRSIFDYPDMLWEPILRTDQRLRSNLVIRIH